MAILKLSTEIDKDESGAAELLLSHKQRDEGEYKGALYSLKKALALAETDNMRLYVHYNLAVIYERFAQYWDSSRIEDNFEKCIAELDKALKYTRYKKDEHAIKNVKADILRIMGKLDESIEVCNEVIDDPTPVYIEPEGFDKMSSKEKAEALGKIASELAKQINLNDYMSSKRRHT